MVNILFYSSYNMTNCTDNESVLKTELGVVIALNYE